MGIWYDILESNKETEKPKNSAFSSAGTILLLGKEDYTKSFLINYLKDEEKNTKKSQIRHYDWVSFGSTQAFNNAMMGHSSAKHPEKKDSSTAMVPFEIDFMVVKPEDLKNSTPKPISSTESSGTIVLGSEKPESSSSTPSPTAEGTGNLTSEQTIQIFALNEPSFLNLIKPMFTFSELEKTVVVLTFPFDANIEKNLDSWLKALKTFVNSLAQKYTSAEDSSINFSGCQKKLSSYYQDTTVAQNLVPDSEKPSKPQKIVDYIEKNTDISENLGVPIIFVGIESDSLDKVAKDLEKSSRYPTGGSLAEHFKNYVQKTIRNKALPYSASIFYLNFNNSKPPSHGRSNSAVSEVNPVKKLRNYIYHRLFGIPFSLNKENMLSNSRELIIPSGFDTGLAIKSLDIFSLLTGEGKKTPAPLEKYFEKVSELNDDSGGSKPNSDGNSGQTSSFSTVSSAANVEKYEDFLKRMEKIHEEMEKKDSVRKNKSYSIENSSNPSATSSSTSDESSNPSSSKDKDSDQEPAEFFQSFATGKKKVKTVASSSASSKTEKTGDAAKESPAKVKKHVVKKEGLPPSSTTTTTKTGELPPPKVVIQEPQETK